MACMVVTFINFEIFDKFGDILYLSSAYICMPCGKCEMNNVHFLIPGCPTKTVTVKKKSKVFDHVYIYTRTESPSLSP